MLYTDDSIPALDNWSANRRKIETQMKAREMEIDHCVAGGWNNMNTKLQPILSSYASNPIEYSRIYPGVARTPSKTRHSYAMTNSIAQAWFNRESFIFVSVDLSWMQGVPCLALIFFGVEQSVRKANFKGPAATVWSHMMRAVLIQRISTFRA